MHRLIISAPFGNYLRFEGATSTLGTFTLRPRGGKLYRLWRCLRTLRYSRRVGGWVNRLGLPNPGIDSLHDRDCSQDIVSVHGFDQCEWDLMGIYLTALGGRRPAAVELNLSCPNVGAYPEVSDVLPLVKDLLRHGLTVIAKLPPLHWMRTAHPLYEEGVRSFHCCNTIPTPGGGLSGKTLMQYSLWATEEIKCRWGRDVRVIGGGGVTGVGDALTYLKAGADHVAIGSMLLNPLNHHKVRKIAECLRPVAPFVLPQGTTNG